MRPGNTRFVHTVRKSVKWFEQRHLADICQVGYVRCSYSGQTRLLDACGKRPLSLPLDPTTDRLKTFPKNNWFSLWHGATGH